MHLRDFVLCVLLISIDRFATTSSAIVRSRSLQSLPEAMSDLKNIPDKWKVVNPELRAPQIEIYLMKDYDSPDEIRALTNEFKYLSKNFGISMSSAKEKKIPAQTKNKMKTEMRGNEKEEYDDAHNIVMPNRFIPAIGSRNVIIAPTFCPPGEREDRSGQCRIVIE